jgi:hypothetical protein
VKVLKKTFGYIVTQGNAFGQDFGENANEKLFISNALSSPILLRILVS